MSGQLVELKRSVATTMFIVEKGKRGSIHSEENGWLFVRFDGCRFLVPVQSCEVERMEPDPPPVTSHAALALGLLLVVLGGCFAPDLSKLSLRCDAVEHFCPDGLSCVDGFCTDSPAGQTSDLASVDDQGARSAGCQDGSGKEVSGSAPAFACPGTFEASSDPQKGASRLCAPGFKLCSRADTLNQFVCSTLAGFYVADVPTRAALPSASCGVVRSGESAGFAGCGKSVAGVYGVPSCAGFTRGLFVTAGSGLAVAAPFASLDGTTQNTTGSNGVLCCK